MASSSRTSIYAAIAANVGIAVAKLIGFGLTRSSAMLSEGIHSLVDTGNDLLLLFGVHLSERPPDETHPFGYGKEVYFWTLIVAVLVFVLGGGVSVAEGIQHILHPAAITNALVNYIILGVSFLFEGTSLVISIREFRKTQGSGPLYQAIRASKDPSTFTVIFEDSAAVLGLLFAFLGLLCDQLFGWRLADGIASVAIGVLLMVVAVLLTRECKDLLIGEGASLPVLRHIRELTRSDPDVLDAGYPFTMYFGPANILLTMNVKFRPDLTSVGIDQSIDRIETLIRHSYPHVRYIYLETDSLKSPGRPSQPVLESDRLPFPGTGISP